MVTDNSTTAVAAVVSVAALDSGFTCLNDETNQWLQTASGCLNLAPTAVNLHIGKHSHGPRLLRHVIPKHRVQLLALPPPAHGQQQASRSVIYTTAILQHAALLLLLLTSDSLLVVVPAATVPASLLQLLRVLTHVKQLITQQLLALQRLEKLNRRGQHPQGAGAQAAGAEASYTEEQYGHLLQLLQHKLPAQLHIALQAAPTAAAAAVQQAEQTLLKCKAVTADQSLQQGTRSRPANSSSRFGSMLFELAGVYCCQQDSSRSQASRKVMLSAIKNQLGKLSQAGIQQQRPSTGQQKDQQQQQAQATPQLQSTPQVLASLAAAAAAQKTTAGADQMMHSGMGQVADSDLLCLWQQLLQLLFSDAAKAPQLYPFHTHAAMQLSDALDDIITAGDDVIDGSEDDSSYDESDGGWQEVVHDQDSSCREEGAEAAGEVLAAAVDPLYLLSAKRCMAAAKAAIAHYLKVVPQRYSQAMHEAATAQALALYSTSASGPAQHELQLQLVQCCLSVWTSGRQQCSAISLTGRQCTLSPHNTTVPHSSGLLLHLAAPDGSSMALQPDWFSIEAANTSQAEVLQQQQKAGSKLLQVATMTVQQRSRQESGNILQLGPWLSAWVLGCGSGAYDPNAGLPGPGWLPGFNKLLQFGVFAHAIQAGSAGAARVGGTTAVEQTHASGRGSGGRGRAAATAAAAGGGGSWGQGRGHRGGRGQHGKAAAALALGPEDFPTLAEAVTSKKRAGASGPVAAASTTVQQQQQQQQGEVKTAAQPGKGGKASNCKGDTGAHQQQQAAVIAQQQLIEAWTHLDQPQVSGVAAASSSGNSLFAAAGGAGAGADAGATGGGHEKSESGLRGGGGFRGRGRGGRQGHKGVATAAAAAGATVGGGDRQISEVASVLATVSIGLEYESLSGVRAIFQPVQLLQSLQQEQQQQTAATAAASSAVRNLPPTDRQQHKKGGKAVSSARQQQGQALQQQQQHASDSSRPVLGVEQLLLQDIPLFMPPALSAGTADATAVQTGHNVVTQAGPPNQANSTEHPLLLPVDLQLLQLQRIYVRTPPVPFALASKPCIHFVSAASTGAANDTGDSSTGISNGTLASSIQASAADATGSTHSSVSLSQKQPANGAAISAPSSAVAASSIEFSTSRELTLPADSLVVLSLPKVYAAPNCWAQLVDPAAAAAMLRTADQSSSSCNSSTHAHERAAVGVTASTVSAGVLWPKFAGSSSGSPITPKQGSVAAQAAETGSALSYGVAVDKVEGAADNRTVGGEIILPLIPAKLQAAYSGAAGSSNSSSSDALCCWSACLKAGSWLYPAAAQQGREEKQERVTS